MPYEFQKIRCQRCRAANPFGQELCDQCGTRLMLVVEPTALRFEEDSAAEAPHPALLLERMTILEGGLTRFAEKLERGFDLMLKQAENIHREHLLLESLIITLVQSGIITRDDLERLWRATIERNEAEQRQRSRRESARALILAAPPDTERDFFSRLVNEGFTQLAAGDVDGGLKKLENATTHAPDNFPLHSFIGEQYFRTGSVTLSVSYLTRALDLDPNDARTMLLLGVLLADEGAEKINARTFIEHALLVDKSFAGRYALGRIAAIEGDWKKAYTEFRHALTVRPRAESHFVFALACFKVSRLRLALRHARKALALDERYGEAYLLLGLIHRREKDHARAREAFAHAAQLRGNAAAAEGEKPARRNSEQSLLAAFFGSARQTGTRLLSAGDARLAKLWREEALAFRLAAR
jgi:tetratricopeptide (TPR) repeat protein